MPSATVSAPVQVVALGNVYIRRGPDLAFDPIGSLSKGAVVTATGRDVLSNWVRVPLPEDSSRLGWISIMSEFTDVHGDLRVPAGDRSAGMAASWLPCATAPIMSFGSSRRGVTLPPVYEFPNNDLRLNPGTYSILDVDVEGYPEILKADLREGMTIEVLIDGLGEKKKCPPP